MQNHERPNFIDLASEALNARPAFSNLPTNVQLKTVYGVTQLITDLEGTCKGSWNNVTFRGSDISVFQHTYEDQTGLALTLRQKLKDFGLHPKTASTLINGSLKDSVMMIQGHVTTMKELKRILGKFEKGKSRVEGRTFRSNKVGPPSQIRTGLSRGRY